jgi:hypothetical protein
VRKDDLLKRGSSNAKWQMGESHDALVSVNETKHENRKQNFRKGTSKFSICTIKETDRKRMGARELTLK